MRILHVTDCYLPRLGGIELHVRDLATRQSEAGHHVAVLTSTGGPAGEGRVPVRRLPRGSLLLPDVAIHPALEEFSPDVVHAHLSVASPFALAAVRAAREFPAVATIHSMLPDRPRVLQAAVLLAGLPAGRVTMTAVSDAAARPWRHAFPAAQVQVLHNGIDPGDWVQVPSRHPGFAVISVGRFTRRKRHLALVGALAELCRRDPRLRVHASLVGDGPERSRIESAVRRAGLQDVVSLPGILSRQEIRARFAAADVYVAPATNESFGIAALEARCAGLPVIGMALSGVGEFVAHEQEGLLALDEADLADQLWRLVTDPGLCAAIRSHNTATAPRMTWPAVLRRTEAIYSLATGTTAPVAGAVGAVGVDSEVTAPL